MAALLGLPHPTRNPSVHAAMLRRLTTMKPNRTGAWNAALALLAAVGLATGARTAAGHEPSDTGRVLRLTMEAPSLHERSRTVRVYLPPSYSTPEGQSRRYPVIYLLHGWPGSDGNLLSMGHVDVTADSLIAEGKIPEVILVFPNGEGSGLLGRSYWMDGAAGSKPIEDYVTRDLVEWVDAHYRTIANASGRGLIGISDGGDAAFNLCLRHPDLFSAAGGHSADYVLGKGLGTSGFLGPEPEADELLRENSPALYIDHIAPELARLHLYLDCGTSDESIAYTRAFHHKLVALGVAHEYHEFPGSHTWGYWSAHLAGSLTSVADALH